MDQSPIDDLEWAAAPADHFTGDAWFGPMSLSEDPDGLDVLGVQFAPGARTDWHRHPGGQVLHVISGSGIVASVTGERVVMAAGDTVTTLPNDLHWHGAGPDSPLLHLSITVGGKTVWAAESVTDEQYAGRRDTENRP